MSTSTHPAITPPLVPTDEERSIRDSARANGGRSDPPARYAPGPLGPS